MTEVTPAVIAPETLAERIARLRVGLHSSPQGRRAVMELFPLKKVQPDRDSTVWEQSWPEWLARLQTVGLSLGWDQGWEQSWSQW